MASENCPSHLCGNRSVTQKSPTRFGEPNILCDLISQYNLLNRETQEKFIGILGFQWQQDPDNVCSLVEWSPYNFFHACLILWPSVAALEAWVALPRPKGYETTMRMRDESKWIYVILSLGLESSTSLSALGLGFEDTGYGEPELDALLYYDPEEDSPLADNLNRNLGADLQDSDFYPAGSQSLIPTPGVVGKDVAPFVVKHTPFNELQTILPVAVTSGTSQDSYCEL